MEVNPYNKNASERIKGVIAVIISAILLFSLLLNITGASLLANAASAVVYIVVFYIAAYYYWYISGFMAAFQARAVLAIVAQAAICAVAFAVSNILELWTPDNFRLAAPSLAVFGILLWSIIVQDYAYKKERNCDERVQEFDEPAAVENQIDRVSVKEGSKIHIIKANDILYIQAYGDYVMIITETGKYLKDQTMKFFETNLPENFIRIHRSCIVNSNVIARAELFAKESYNIYLNNGACIRASAAGYKLLKDKLLL
jgi:DNA-binding LytR/AlgR family response regulator